MSHAQKVQYWIWLAVLLVAVVYFWIWWLRPEHNIGTLSYVLNLIVVEWLTLLLLYFILILSRARVPSPELPVAPGYRVVMVVTKTPNLFRLFGNRQAALWRNGPLTNEARAEAN